MWTNDDFQISITNPEKLLIFRWVYRCCDREVVWTRRYPRGWGFSWAGDKLRMSTWRPLRKYRGSSPSRQKRYPLVLCCCKSLDCKSPPRIVYGPRCESLPGLLRRLAWRRILLPACPVEVINRFNQGWNDSFILLWLLYEQEENCFLDYLEFLEWMTQIFSQLRKI